MHINVSLKAHKRRRRKRERRVGNVGEMWGKEINLGSRLAKEITLLRRLLLLPFLNVSESPFVISF